MTDETCTAGEAVDRAMRLLHRCRYELGTGDYFADERPQLAFDCCGFAVSYAWKLRRHRPGFNRHVQPPRSASVVDDINVDSLYEDCAYGLRELGTALFAHEPPRVGDLAITRSIRKGQVKHAPEFHEMGHVRMFTKGPTSWDPVHPSYVSCTLIQIHGPDGTLGPVLSSGQELDNWNAKWPTADFRVAVVRMHERV